MWYGISRGAWHPSLCLEGDDIMDASLFEAADNDPRVSPTLAEEAAFLGDDPTSQKGQKTTTSPPDHVEETPESKGAARLKWATADPQDAQE